MSTGSNLVVLFWDVLKPLGQWFSTFLVLRPYNTVTHVVVTSQPQNYFCYYFVTVILPLF